jgi:single-strand DNA-binding protein
MSSLNKVQLIGNLGNDPDIINEGKIAKFSLATSESWNDKTSGEKMTKTEWHNIVVYNEGLVGVIQQYVKKGSKVYVEGQLQTRKWEDKDGATRYTTEVVLQGFNSTLTMLGEKNSSQESSTSSNTPSTDTSTEIDDDIPF